MIERLKKILALIKKEFIITWMDPKSRAIIVALPIVQLILFSYAITMEVRNIDMVVVDQDNSVESRELISRFEFSPQFRNIYRAKAMRQLQDKIDNKDVSMGLYINNDFSTNINAKIPTDVLIITDGRQTNSAAIVGGYASQIVANYSQEIAPVNRAQINVVTRNWYNPNLEYRWFILTVIVAMLASVITLILTALSIAREREMGTFDQLIVSPLSAVDILAGKTVPPLTIAMALTCVMTFVVSNFFGMPFEGSIILFLISMLISLLSLVGVGLYISSICRTQQQAILGVITFMMPAVLLSGFISPIEDMPVFLQYLTLLNPIRFFMILTRGIFLKGMTFFDISMNLIPLIITATITLSMACWSFKKRQN